MSTDDGRSWDDEEASIKHRLETQFRVRAGLIAGGDNRPEIRITTREWEAGNQAIEALRECPDLYTRGGSLVQVSVDGPTPRIASVPRPRLRELLSQYVRWTSVKKSKDAIETVASHPPDWAVKAVESRGSWPGLRPLESIVEVPVLRPDGTLLDTPGWDTATGLLFVPGIEFASVSARPTRTEALSAAAELFEAVVDFPFASPLHRAAWLAATLTPFARHAINGPVPLFLVDKNVRGAGSGLLVDTSSIIATGRPSPVMTNPDDDIEMGKVITSLVVAGASFVLIDNVAGELGGAALDAALTGRTWHGRILGNTQMSPELPIRMCWWATGNNVQLVADTARRVLHIRLESPEERPEERTNFRHADLRAWVLSQRPRLVRAALTLLRGYVVAGRPCTGLKRWGSFEEWTDLVRGAVVWAGEPDPGETRIELAGSDSEANALAALIEGLENADPRGAGLTATQILKIVESPGNDHQGLKEAVGEFCPGSKRTSRSLGKKLAHVRKRVVHGKWIDSFTGHASAQFWLVRKTKTLP